MEINKIRNSKANLYKRYLKSVSRKKLVKNWIGNITNKSTRLFAQLMKNIIMKGNLKSLTGLMKLNMLTLIKKLINSIKNVKIMILNQYRHQQIINQNLLVLSVSKWGKGTSATPFTNKNMMTKKMTTVMIVFTENQSQLIWIANHI